MRFRHRTLAALLALVVLGAPLVSPVLEALGPPRAEVTLTDVHPPGRCPDAHSHFLCIQVQHLFAWPAPAPALEVRHRPDPRVPRFADATRSARAEYDSKAPRAPPTV